MSLKKSGVKEGNSTLQDSGLYGIIDKTMPTTQMNTDTVKLPVRMNYQARRSAVNAVLKAEQWKAQVSHLIRQMSIR